jgi:cyclase
MCKGTRLTNVSALPVAPLFLLVALVSVARAQAPANETLKPVKDNVYVASGSTGSNNGVILGTKGVIVVDTGITADSEKAELAEIAEITPKPVEAALITHSDGDHVNGLTVLPAGITIITQENCNKEMQAANSHPTPNAPTVPLATKMIGMKGSETIDGVRFQFFHVAPAHTSGDLVVYLPQQKIVFTGDIISGANSAPYPIIHLEKNGSSQGWIETTTAIVALDADTFVPGHGDVHTKADIQQRLDAVKARRAEIQALVKEGKSLDAVKEALGESAPPAGGNRFPSFTEVVYKELTTK